MKYNFKKENKALIDMMFTGESLIAEGPIDHELAELIKLRLSDINHCQHCSHMHRGELEKLKVAEDKLEALADYQSSDLFNAQEKLVLSFAEAINTIKDVQDFTQFEELKDYYSEEDIIEIVLIVNNINSWNRYNIISEQL